jgi:hypothetical protein
MLSNKYVASLTGILLVLAIAYNVQFFLSRGDDAKTKVGAAIPPVSKGSVITRDKDWERIGQEEDRNPWRRDPFGLKEASEKAAPKPPPQKTAEEIWASKLSQYNDELHVSGVIKRNGRGHALINGKVYAVDDVIGDAVIEQITRHGIVLLSEGMRYELAFHDYVILEEKTK